jgi:predicted porin
LWAECYEARFEVPGIGNADTLSYYLEAKYKITPQLFAALRWNQQLFGTIRNGGELQKWGSDIWRIDAALGYRFTNYLQAKVQYSLSQQNSAQEGEHLVAVQLTVKY